MPFAVETFGAWGKEATAFAKLQTRAIDRGINPLEFYYHFCSELSITLQIGNAKVLESALQAARSGKAAELPSLARAGSDRPPRRSASALSAHA